MQRASNQSSASDQSLPLQMNHPQSVPSGEIRRPLIGCLDGSKSRANPTIRLGSIGTNSAPHAAQVARCNRAILSIALQRFGEGIKTVNGFFPYYLVTDLGEPGFEVTWKHYGGFLSNDVSRTVPPVSVKRETLARERGCPPVPFHFTPGPTAWTYKAPERCCWVADQPFRSQGCPPRRTICSAACWIFTASRSIPTPYSAILVTSGFSTTT